jgi:hypothetical protein
VRLEEVPAVHRPVTPQIASAITFARYLVPLTR